MLEGNEVDQKLGDIGNVVVDVTPEIRVKAALSAALDKDLIAAIPGGLKVKGTVQLELDADPVLIALHELANSQSAVAKFLAGELAKLRAGEEPHPAVAAALAAPAAAPVAPQA